MPLRLILGSSGSGKSYKACKEIIEKSIQNPLLDFFIVVPEQFTLQTQKEIVKMHPNHGTMNIDIVSFERLAFRISEELGIKTPEILDDTGKSLVLRKIVEENKLSLNAFKSKIKMPGFVEEMKSMIAELYQYGIGEDTVNRIIDVSEKKPLLKAKIDDVSVIYKAFKKYLEDKFVTSEEILEILYKIIPKSNLIKNSEIYLDGFTGFTPIQYKVIEVLLKYSKKVNVCITINPENLNLNIIKEYELFNLSKHTIKNLVGICENNDISILEDEIISENPPYRFKTSKSIAYIEKNIFREKPGMEKENPEGIKISSFRNPTYEIEYVARMICKLVREEGYRYKDIAVITGSMEEIHHRIERAFKVNKIPTFIDYKKDILSNPFIESISSVLEIIEKDFSYESVFRYLRSGMSGIEKESIDRIENYVLENGIRGKKLWGESWNEELDSLKEDFYISVKNLSDRLNAENLRIKDFCTSLFEFIRINKMEDKLNNYAYDFYEEESFELSDEYLRIYKLTMDLLDEIVFLLGDEKASLSEFVKIIESGFVEIKVGLIPQTSDSVVVGDIERTRLKDIKVLFILNINEGTIPSLGKGRGLISDKEREFLKKENIELSPTFREKLFIQKFYLYLNLTKPSEKLFLSYSKGNAEGKSLRPSYLIYTIKNMFKDIEIEDEGEEYTIDYITSYQTALNFIANGIAKGEKYINEDQFKEAYSLIINDEESKEKINNLISLAFPEKENSYIDKAIAQVIYGDETNVSVSRLENFVRCAYSHFLNYGLKLLERKEYKIEAVDLGNLYHSSLETFNKKLIEKDYTLKNLPENIRKELVGECVEAVAEEYGNNVLKSNARNNYIINRLKRITDKTIWALTEHQKREKFEPKHFEKSFFDDLKGRIDRIDTYEDGDDVYVKVIDYKSGNNVYSIVDTYYNLQMQLVVYMDEAINIIKKEHPKKNVLPGGIFYYNIKDPFFARDENVMDEFRMTGALNAGLAKREVVEKEIYKKGKKYPELTTEEFTGLIEYVKNSAKKISENMESGDISVNPCSTSEKLPCEYCSFGAICNFDSNLNDYEEVLLDKISPEEVLEKIKEGINNNER